MGRGTMLGLGAALLLAAPAAGQGPATLQRSLKDVDVHGAWVYNDLDRGFAQARQTGKPLLVVFR